MQPDRAIVRMYRRSDSLTTRPDDLRSLIPQPTCTNVTPKYSLCGPVTRNPDRTRPYSTLRLHLYLRLQS